MTDETDFGSESRPTGEGSRPVAEAEGPQTGGEVDSCPPSGRALFGERLPLAERYVGSLASDGVERGLIGPRETPRLWSRHVLNSAVVAELLPQGATVVDVGSGAGLPGIPLAIARPDCTLFLVEPLLRRSLYLAEIVADWELTNVRVVRGRAEDVAADLASATGGGADVVTSRAVAPLAKLARWSVPLLKVGGLFLPLKGASAAEEIERDAAALSALGLGPATVVEVGAGVVDPVTSLVRAELVRPGAGATSPAGRRSGSRRPRR